MTGQTPWAVPPCSIAIGRGKSAERWFAKSVSRILERNPSDHFGCGFAAVVPDRPARAVRSGNALHVRNGPAEPAGMDADISGLMSAIRNNPPRVSGLQAVMPVFSFKGFIDSYRRNGPTLHRRSQSRLP